jgi:hypothetical protein
MKLDKLSLKSIGCTESEIAAIDQAKNDAEQIRQIRVIRCRMLEEIHQKQKQLDELDYILYQKRNRRM